MFALIFELNIQLSTKVPWVMIAQSNWADRDEIYCSYEFHFDVHYFFCKNCFGQRCLKKRLFIATFPNWKMRIRIEDNDDSVLQFSVHSQCLTMNLTF